MQIDRSTSRLLRSLLTIVLIVSLAMVARHTFASAMAHLSSAFTHCTQLTPASR